MSKDVVYNLNAGAGTYIDAIAIIRALETVRGATDTQPYVLLERELQRVQRPPLPGGAMLAGGYGERPDMGMGQQQEAIRRHQLLGDPLAGFAYGPSNKMIALSAMEFAKNQGFVTGAKHEVSEVGYYMIPAATQALTTYSHRILSESGKPVVASVLAELAGNPHLFGAFSNDTKKCLMVINTIDTHPERNYTTIDIYAMSELVPFLGITTPAPTPLITVVY